MDITPDTKDWTWVIEARCEECGFDSRAISTDDVATLIRGNSATWSERLGGPAARVRPRPDVWSPLEYACHVRDVHRLYAERLDMVLTQDDPTYPNWDQDRTAVELRYQDQDPAVVLDELHDSAEAIAARFDAVSGDQWQRGGRRSDGASFTIDTFARYYVHDITHHIHDVGGSP